MLTNNLNECCCILTYSQGTHWEFCEESCNYLRYVSSFFFHLFAQCVNTLTAGVNDSIASGLATHA